MASGPVPAGGVGTQVAGFLAMGGYAAYVWPAFGFTVAVMAGLFAQSWRAARAADRDLAELRAAARPAREPRAARPLVARRETSPGPDARERV
jgi:heme exporter protein D